MQVMNFLVRDFFLIKKVWKTQWPAGSIIWIVYRLDNLTENKIYR